MAQLPEALFDGQVFIDFYRIKWVYSKATNSWERIGKVNAVPVADGTNVGYLPKNFKFLLDSVPEHGGGFALITKPLLARRSLTNPDGIIFGDVKLTSNSFDIKCVNADGGEIDDACRKVAFHEYDIFPPGFDINFSDLLLDNLCLEIPGGPGPQGPDGEKGDSGLDGTGDGPVGLKGQSGKDATEVFTLSGIKIIDVDDIFDTAVVKLELDAPKGKLFISKGKVALPDDADVPADKLVVSQISRTINFGDCWDYKLVKVPCRNSDDFDILDPMVAFYPENFDPNALDGTKDYVLIRGRLSQLINQIISTYQSKLEDASTTYDKMIEDFIKAKDVEARKVLDELGDRLAECENITYLEYCVGIKGECNQKVVATAASPGGSTPEQDPICESLAKMVCPADTPNGVGNYQAATCKTIIDNLTITADRNPVFAMPGIPPMPKIPMLDNGYVLASDRKRIWEEWRDGPVKDAFKKAYVIYPKQQLNYNEMSPEFPPGAYVLVYQGGSFRQETRNDKERYGTNPEQFINGAEKYSVIDQRQYTNGAFQDYWLGDEVNHAGGFGYGSSILPVLYAFDMSDPGYIPILNTSVGVQLGYVKVDAGYQNQLPDSYFDAHKFDINYEVGNPGIYLPNPRNDFAGLSEATRKMEDKITWLPFPTIGSRSDSSSLESAYKNATLPKKSIFVSLTVPCYFFIRVRVAFCPTNSSCKLMMPPVIKQGSQGGGLPLYDYSNNFLSFYAKSTVPSNPLANAWAYINAKPFAQGQASFKMYQVECAPPVPESSTSYVPGGQE